MMEKALLLVDDSKDHLGTLEQIKNKIKQEFINLTVKHIDPIHKDYWNEDKNPTIEKVLKGIEDKLKGIKPNLIIVDQFYSDVPTFKGIDIIERLRKMPKFKKCTIFLISGKRKKIVQDVFDDKKTDKDKVNKLAKLINLKIDSFLDKDFKSEAIRILKQRNINEIFPSKLRNYENDDLKIHTFPPKSKSYTLEDLADKIENDDDEVNDILNEMFDMMLAYYTKIDEKL